MPLEDFAEANVQSAELQELTKKVLSAEQARTRSAGELRLVKRTLEEVETELSRAHEALTFFEEPIPQKPAWLKTPKAQKGHRGTLLAFLSDTHFGEVVKSEAMAGFNAFNMEIAEKRTYRFFERVIHLTRHYISGVKYDGVVLALGGDIVSGDIHDELLRTNELSTYETLRAIRPWLVAGIEMFAEEFGNVHVVSAPGNHGRNRRKPEYKDRSANNADTLLAWNLADHFEKVKNITFDVPNAISTDFSIYGTNFRLEHGDEAKGGTGIAGALSPLMIRVNRLRKQAQAEGRPFDILLTGHWHQLMSLPAKGIIVNGSLKGYDEYARGKGFEPELPQQALLAVSPEHGIGIQVPIFVSSRKNEGW